MACERSASDSPGRSLTWITAAFGLGKSEAKRALGTPAPWLVSNTSWETNCGLSIVGMAVSPYRIPSWRIWRRNWLTTSSRAASAACRCLALDPLRLGREPRRLLGRRRGLLLAAPEALVELGDRRVDERTGPVDDLDRTRLRELAARAGKSGEPLR